MDDGEGSDSGDEGGEPRGAPQDAEQPAAADSTPGHLDTDKAGKPPAVITVLADCTKEGSPQDTLALVQDSPQQPAAEPSSAPAAETLGASQRPAAPASDSAGIEALAPVQEASQVLQLRESAMTAQQLTQDRVQQEAVPEGWAAAAQPPGHAWSAVAEHAEQADLAAEALLSPKRHRQPSSKAAEAPGSPGRLMSPAQRKRMARSRRVWKEGTYIGSGIWLMCYCAKHQHALEQMGASRWASSALSQPVALCLAALYRYASQLPGMRAVLCSLLALHLKPQAISIQGVWIA